MAIDFGNIFNISSFRLPQSPPSKNEASQSGSEIFPSSVDQYTDHVNLGGERARTSGNIKFEGTYHPATFSSNVSDDTRKLLAELTRLFKA